MKSFILVIRDTGYHLIGPFDTNKDASKWAFANWDETKGDPRWQVLQLTGWSLAPAIIEPQNGQGMI